MLQLRNVVKRYKGITALDDVSYEAREGCITALLGPNGSGKSTMLKICAGLTRPTSGMVLLDGNPFRIADKGRVSYVPQENCFYGYMKVQDAKRFYADFFSDFNRERFEELARDADLPRDRKISQFSGGMKAKLKACCALARDARVFLLDEPFNGLDMLTRDWLLQKIKETVGKDRTIFISSHLVEELEGVAGEMLCLSKSKIILSGSAEGVSLVDTYRRLYGREEEAYDEI